MELSKNYKWILMFLSAGDDKMRYNAPVIGKTRLVKELFLLKKRGKIHNMYSFKADKYGPSSNEIIIDLDLLEKLELINTEPHVYGTKYFLTRKGLLKSQKYSNENIRAKIENIKRNYNKMPLNKLLVYVYSAFPKYTTKSLIKDEI